MRYRIPLLVFLLLLSFGRLPRAAASPEQDARIAISAECILMDRSLVQHSASAYLAFLHPDFVRVYPQGKEIHGKAQYVASLRQLFAPAGTLTSTTRVLSCLLQAGGAVVTTEEQGGVSSRSAGKPLDIKRVDQVRSFWVIAANLTKSKSAVRATHWAPSVTSPHHKNNQNFIDFLSAKRQCLCLSTDFFLSD